MVGGIHVLIVMKDIREKELIMALKQGDIKAYEELFRWKYDHFLRFAHRILKDIYVSEDILQNVFMKLWTHRQNLDETMSLHNYLFVLTKNQIYSYLRSKRNYLDIDGDGVIDLPISLDEEAFEAREMGLILTGIIEAMPPQRQAIFKLSRYDQMPDKLIAEKLKLSVRTVEKHIQLALKDIRGSMQKLVSLLL